MYGYIYLTEDLFNNKIYIGLHKSEVFDESYYGSGRIISNLLKKYGTKRFKCSLLCECNSLDELNEKEKEYIKLYNSTNRDIGYNISIGGTSWGYHLGMLGKHLSEYQKEVVRKSSSYIRDEDARRNMSRSKLGNSNAKGNKGLIYIYKDGYCTKCKKEELDSYILQGFVPHKKYISDEAKERIKDKYKNGTYITKEGLTRYIDNQDLESYLLDGWIIGRSGYTKERGLNISNSKKGCIAITDGIRNYYIKPLDWPSYEDSGYYKMSLSKFNKLNNVKTP